MNFYIEKVAPIGEIQIANYESFGWRLPDLLYNTLKPLRIPEPTSGTCHHGSKMTSEESSASGNRLHEIDENQSMFDSEHNITINKKDSVGKSSTNQVNPMNPLFPLRITGSSFRNLRSRSAVNEKMFEDSSSFRQDLAALINKDSPYHRYLENIMNLDSEAQYQIPAKVTTGTQIKEAAISTRNTKYISDFGIKLQDDSACQVHIHHKGLSTFVESALLIEHDTDRELEGPRKHFLQTVTQLDSRLRFLYADSRRLHADIKTLQQDFQVSLGVSWGLEKRISFGEKIVKVFRRNCCVRKEIFVKMYQFLQSQ
jgi:hypothetical protein